jgi:transcription elongation factor Elf1
MFLSLAQKNYKCFICKSTKLFSMNYPGVNTKIWSDCDVIGCSNCGFSYVSNFPFSSIDEYYKNQYGKET